MTSDNEEGSANAASLVGRTAQRLPKLSSAQIARLEGRGTHVRMSKGDILMEPGDRNRPMLVVLSGSIDVLQSALNILSRYDRAPSNDRLN